MKQLSLLISSFIFCLQIIAQNYTIQQKTELNNGALHLGYDVSISNDGNTALVAALTGSAYVYKRINDSFLLSATLKPDITNNSNPQVEISGDGKTAILGLYDNTTYHGTFYSGIAFIFHLDNNLWSQQAVLLPPTNSNFSSTFYGYSLALSYNGNVAAVGAQLQPTISNGTGVVYTYKRTQGVWVENSIIKHTLDNANAQFGASVSLSDDGKTLAVGDDDYNGGEGRAFVYEKSGNNFIETPLVLSNPLHGGTGYSIAVSGNGNVIAVGAPFTSDSAINTGAVYIFKKTNNIWQYNAKIEEANAKQEDSFGWDISLDSNGTNVLVGCHAGKTGSQVYKYAKGKAFLYTDKQIKGWVKNVMLIPAMGNTGDGYGYDVSLAADAGSYIVGAPFATDTYFNQGYVYIYSTNATTLLVSADASTANKACVIKISPNPATVNILIQTPFTDGYLTICNTAGLIIDKKKINSTQTALHISKYIVGTYYVLIQTDTVTQTIKFIKE